MVNKKISKPKYAYTLVELSIVILILAVLMTGSLTITIGSFNKANVVENRIFSNISGYIRGAVGSRVFKSTTNINIFYGFIPAKTLNLLHQKKNYNNPYF